MVDLQLTSIDSLPVESTVVVKFGINRTWKIITLTLVVISLILITSIIIIVVKRNELITATSNNYYINVNSTIDITATTTYCIDEQEKETTVNFKNASFIDVPYSISDFGEFETSFGFSLNHSIYYNIHFIHEIKGYVTSVTLRLFTSWKGDAPLYIFTVKHRASLTYDEITHRYPLIPERNNTEWQTIQIPLRKFPVTIDDYVAIGMQDKSDTNQIYAVHGILSMNGKNVTNDTRDVHTQPSKNFYSVAFMYTIFKYGN